MQAVVKTPHIKIDIKGEIPGRLVKMLRDIYGKKVRITEEIDNGYVIATETEWYKKEKATMTPGDVVKIYRENKGWSQAELGEKLGGVTRHNVSHMERGTRSMSLKMAKKLAELFNIPVNRFVSLM